MIASIGNDPLCMVRFDLSGNGAAEISLNMNPNARGKGYAEKILLEACRYGISNLDLNLIHASIKVENEPSIRTFEAVGFVLQGTSDSFLRYALQLCGQRLPCLFLSVFSLFHWLKNHSTIAVLTFASHQLSYFLTGFDC